MSSSVCKSVLRHTTTRSIPRLSSKAIPRNVRQVGTRGRQTPQPPPSPQSAPPTNSPAGRIISLGLLAVVIGGGYVYLRSAFTEDVQQQVEQPRKVSVAFEKERQKALSKEENRDLISSQHMQVRKSWENPGLYVWGSNSGKVAAPDSKDNIVKTPRRIAYFDGQLLRDVKLDRSFGAAVTENGDLVQWGTGYSDEDPSPVVTLKGKDLVKLAASRDRILALSSSGSVFSLPVAREDQEHVAQDDGSSSWTLFWSSPSKVSYRTISPKDLPRGEKIVDVDSGLEHCLMLTSKGRVFSAVSSSEEFPSKGQMGIPGLTFFNRPDGPYDQPYEVSGLRGFEVKQVATGDYHSIALDKEGRVFTFGDNTVGQLGFPAVKSMPALDAPAPLSFGKLYQSSKLDPKVVSIAAGGVNSYFHINATTIDNAPSFNNTSKTLTARDAGNITADTWACGEGVYGSLGTGKWTHVSNGPVKIKALSGLFEWDEANHKRVPIGLSRMSVGSTHAAAVMDNVTRVADQAEHKDMSLNDTNWGADVVWWGGNEHYQLGTGKRTNQCSPIYIGPLDGGQGDSLKGRAGEAHRFQITPRKKVRLGEGGKGRKVSVEQRMECGRFVTAVYSGT